uniref:AAA+ ATPase domain-containing protein n=1 Tax=Leersia perrieri TaxID=77586 RepID=A0A0D9WVA2_9ORYZ
MEGAIGSLVLKLGYLVSQEYKLLKKVGNDIFFMRNELASISAFLQDLETVEEAAGAQVKEWVNQVRELSYDTEDCIDEFIYLVDHLGDHHDGGSRGITWRSFIRGIVDKIKILKARHDISDRIQELKARVKETSERRARYRLDEAAATSSLRPVSIDPRIPALYQNAANLVGIDKPKDELISWLMDAEGKLKVISVVGLAGIGKTTLAMEVYCTLKASFQCRAFISVSQRPDLKNLLKDMLLQLYQKDAPEDQELDLLQMVTKIREYLLHKRYLVVIDDIWCLTAWQTIKCTLPENNHGSRVIITSRIKSIATFCSPSNFILKLEPLSELASKRLLLGRIFGSIDECPSQFEQVVKKILAKCGVCSQRIMAFNVTILLKRWIAEGFGTEKHGLTAMDIAESYLNELINRCMIQPFQFSYDNKVYTVRVHDLMHDLIVSKSYEQNFVTRITSQQLTIISREKIHRLSVFSTEQEDISCIPERTKMTHARSLVIIGCIKQMPSLSRFRFLRILEIINCEFLRNEDLNNIERLFGLKMFILSDVPVSRLPVHIGELHQLELLLVQNTKVKEFPKNIIKLKKLTHLLTDNIKLPDGITNMQGLQKLLSFDACASSTKAVLEFAYLSNLRMLTLFWNPRDDDDYQLYEKCLIASLKRLSNLEELYIIGNGGFSLEFLLEPWPHQSHILKRFVMEGSYWFPCIPNWIKFQSNLSYLDINVKEAKEEELELLGLLPCLLHLELWTRSAADKAIVIPGKGFSSLRYFLLGYRMLRLIFQPDCMPKLQKLYLWGETSVCVLSTIENLPSCLKEVHVKIHGENLSYQDIREAKDAISTVAKSHPSHPKIYIDIVGDLAFSRPVSPL